jgi:hypothetical protein
MFAEIRPLARSYNLALDDLGPLAVINPSDGETWAPAQPKAQSAQPRPVRAQQQATLVRQKVTAYIT